MLKILNSAILYGSSMHNEVKNSQPCLTIAQLLSRNKKRIKEESVPDYEFNADNLVCPSNETDSSRLVHWITTPHQKQSMVRSMEPASA